MANPVGELNGKALRLDFERRLILQFRGSVVTSDAGLFPYRELDDALGLSVIAGEALADGRTGKNGRHALEAVAAHFVLFESEPAQGLGRLCFRSCSGQGSNWTEEGISRVHRTKRITKSWWR